MMIRVIWMMVGLLMLVSTVYAETRLPLTVSRAHAHVLKNHASVFESKLKLEKALADALSAQSVFDTHILAAPQIVDQPHPQLGVQYRLAVFDLSLSHLFRMGVKAEPFVKVSDIRSDGKHYELRTQGIRIEVPILKMNRFKQLSDASRFAVRSAYYMYLHDLTDLMHQTTQLFMDVQLQHQKLDLLNKQKREASQFSDRISRLVKQGVLAQKNVNIAKRYQLTHQQNVMRQKFVLMMAQHRLFEWIGVRFGEEGDVPIKWMDWQKAVDDASDPAYPMDPNHRLDMKSLHLAQESVVRQLDAIQMGLKPDIRFLSLFGYQLERIDGGESASGFQSSFGFQVDVNSDQKSEKGHQLMVEMQRDWLAFQIQHITRVFHQSMAHNKAELEQMRLVQKSNDAERSFCEKELKQVWQQVMKGHLGFESVVSAHKGYLNTVLYQLDLDMNRINRAIGLHVLGGGYFQSVPDDLKHHDKADLLNQHTVDW